MRNVVIIHDSYSSNTEPWIVSVSDELKVRGMNAYVPKFPTPIGQDYISWKVLFDSYAQYLDSECVLVGAGVGAPFILRYLSEHLITVQKTVLIAPFVTPIMNPSEQLLAQTFLLPAFDTTLLKPRMGSVEVVVSDNDLLVDYDTSKRVADMFGARITKLSGKGHFRAVNGVRLMPELVELIAAPVVSTPPVVPPVVPGAQPAVGSMAPQTMQATTAPASQTITSIASNVTPTMTTDVAALQKLLAELAAKGITPPTSLPAQATTTPEAASATTTPSVMPASAASPMTAPSSHATAPVVGEVESITFDDIHSKPATVAHSLVSDFSASLINANAQEVSKTLNDYRQGKEYSAKEKVMRVLRVVAVMIGLVLLLGAGYFAYRVYFFHETLPTITELEVPPLGAISTEPVEFERNVVTAKAISQMVDGLSQLDLSNADDIGVLALSDEEGVRTSSEAAMRMIGGTTPSSIYTKLGKFYAIGSIKNPTKSSPFAVFSLAELEPEVAAELKTWESWMVRDLLGLFAPASGITTESHDFRFESRNVGNRAVRVLVAQRKAATAPVTEPVPVELPSTVIKSNGVPDTTTPVLSLETTLNADEISQSASSELALSQDNPTQIGQLADQVGADINIESGVKQEKNIIDLFKISADEQTAIKRTRDSLTIASNSPIFNKAILPGDIFALESSDKEEEDTLSANNIELSTQVAPILGGAPTIIQITDIFQKGTTTELSFKPLSLSEAIALQGQEVFSNTLPNGASVLAPELPVVEYGPIDIFGYSIVNGKVLIFSADVDTIPLLAEKYFSQKKSIFEMFQ